MWVLRAISAAREHGVTVVGLTGRTGGEMCVERGFELPSRALAARHAVPAIYEVRSLLSSQ